MGKIEVVGSEYAGEPVVLTGNAWYTDREDVRFEAALQFAEVARDEGVPAVAVDASPEHKQGTWVADALRAREATVLRAEIPGIATQRQQGVSFAVSQGAEKVVGTELEKTLVPLLAGKIAIALDSADVLVIGRTPVAENSLPLVQQRAERLAGWILQETLALPADSLAGPRGFTVAGAEVLADYPALEHNPNTGKDFNNWLYLYMTPMTARERGLRVGGVAASFLYPEKIVTEETGNPDFDKKRLDQFHMQLVTLMPMVGGENAPARAYGIAALTSAYLPSIAPEYSSATRITRLAELERQLVTEHGYTPAARLA